MSAFHHRRRVALFFVSGAGAASVVMGTVSSRGNIEPKGWLVAMWGILTILAALPFLFVMVGMVAGLLRELRREPLSATMAPEIRALATAAARPAPANSDAS